MSTPWINRAVMGGGVLTIHQMLPKKTIFRAQMDWSDGSLVQGTITMDVGDCVESLENVCKADGEKQMKEKPNER